MKANWSLNGSQLASIHHSTNGYHNSGLEFFLQLIRPALTGVLQEFLRTVCTYATTNKTKCKTDLN